MKNFFAFMLAFVLFIPIAALSEATEEWQTAPVIKQAYEISSGKLYLEWEGKAPVYQVYMDGKSVASVIVNNAVISVEKGTHTLQIYPINETKNAETKIEIGLDAGLVAGTSIGGSLGLDLAALGLDPKKLVAGNPSEPLSIDYSTSTFFESTPENLMATTNEKDYVLLSFTDRYHADEYVVAVKVGKDVNYVKYTKGEEKADALIQQNKTVVTLTLAPDFLEEQECMVPELDSKYTFSVQLRKYAENLLTGEKVLTAVHQSKESSGYQYTPVAAWKTAPNITYASQTADGEITLQWDHNDYERGCEYSIMKINKTLGIKTGEEAMGTTNDCCFVVNDLMNGDYTISVVPRIGNEIGAYSAETVVNIKNDWVIAPILSCEEMSDNSVRLSWTAVEGIETYHVTVYRGDNESLLRFIDMDYAKYEEYDIPAVIGEMEHVFTYNEEIDNSKGVKFKFEVYGIRYTANSEEQRTALSSQSLTLGVIEETQE